MPTDTDCSDNGSGLYSRLRDSSVENADGFEQDWQSLQSEWRSKPPFDQWNEQQLRESFCDTGIPLVDVMTAVEFGLYPPPEILLALWVQWQHYLRGDSESLERALLGPSKPKLGNYAARKDKRATDHTMAGMIAMYVRRGDTQLAAAEKVVKLYELDIDPESLIRRLRNSGAWALAARFGIKEKKADEADVFGELIKHSEK